MNKKQRILLTASVTLCKAVVTFRGKKTPSGDEYARRALKALRALRDGDYESCGRWTGLIVVKV